MSVTDRPCDCPAAATAGSHRVTGHEQDCGVNPADPRCTCWGCRAEQVAYHQVLFSRVWRKAA